MGFRDWLCSDERVKLRLCEAENRRLAERLAELTECYTRCLAERSQYAADCFRDKWYLSDRVSELSGILARSIQVPDIKSYVGDPVIYDPWGDPPPIVDHVVADNNYYCYPYESWVGILAPIQAEVKKTLKRWQSEVSDCDDFALVMAGLVAVAFRNVGGVKQGAFFVAWSSTHAYNVFRDASGDWWIFEPQNGAVIGKLALFTEKPYDTRKLWALGERKR